MPVYKDQLNREIIIPAIPKRIISLVPSQTELLYDLGLHETVVGITKFCVHPHSWFRDKIRIGGTKNADIEKIKSLHADLIIANKEENTKEQVEALMGFAPVWISDVNSLADALNMIESTGNITGTKAKALLMIAQIKESFGQLQNNNRQLKTCYLIWQDPYMTVGGDNFINDMLNRCGFINILKDERRYPEVSIEKLIELQPEVIFLSSEPYPFKEQHLAEIKAQIPCAKIMLVDGEMFSWYGSRLLHAAAYFKKLQHLLNNNIK